MEDKQSIFTYRFLFSLLFITIGSIIAAAALELILIPNLMIDGGINGISIIFNKLCGGSLGLTVFLFNLPFIMLGYNLIGKKFLIKSGFGMLLFSNGGIALGIGVGLVIKEGGCLDGTETVAILVNRKGFLSVGQVVFIFNIFIYGSAIFVFGPERALYSLLTYFVTYKVIDFVSDGLNSAKAVLIITDDDKEISKEIHKRLGRTVTVISGHGFISHGGKKVLYTVITRFEVSILKDILDEAKGSSFATVTDVSEIIGTHIKKLPENL